MANEQNLKPYKKGQSGNPKGKPVGAISVKARLKKMFREDPDKFEEFIARYLKNPNNEKHVTEMLDGKPNQSVEMEVTMPTPIIPLNNVLGDNSNTEDNSTEEED